MQAWSSGDLVFIDEFGANLAMSPRYGRAPAGHRVRTSRPLSRGRNITFVGALSMRGLRAFRPLPGSCTKVNFIAWVRDFLCPTLRPGKVVLMDNLRAHHAQEVRALIEATGARLEFIPPYSPEFNAIEECWSKVKNIIRKAQARTEGAVILTAFRAARTVTPANARGWIRHAGYRMHRAVSQHA